MDGTSTARTPARSRRAGGGLTAALRELAAAAAPTYAGELARRLRELLADAREESPRDWAFSAESVTGLVEFLREHPELRRPGVTLSPDGNLVARWQDGPEKVLAVEFHSTAEVSYVLFAPARRTIRISALSPPEDMWRTAIANGAAAWCQA